MAQAFEAMRRYEAAKGVLVADPVEWLRNEAESLFEAVHAYQRQGPGRPAPVLHQNQAVARGSKFSSATENVALAA